VPSNVALSLCVALVTGSLSLEQVARAANERTCGVKVAAGDPAPTVAWQRALEGLEADLAAVPGAACAGVELTVTWESSEARVQARTPDGLETSRVVASPDALSAVAFGLLVAAPTEPPQVDTDPRDLPPRDPPAVLRPPKPPTDVLPHLSVSVASGVRGGFPTNVVMVDFELRADLFVHSWLVTIAMRAAPIGVSGRLKDDPDGYEETAIALAVGRELSFGRSSLDVVAGPNLTYIWMENDAANLEAEHAQLRLVALARWGVGVSRRLRVNATLDGEIAPSEFNHTTFEKGLAPFPEFTVGLRIGAELAL